MSTLQALLLVAVVAAMPPPEADPSILYKDSSVLGAGSRSVLGAGSARSVLGAGPARSVLGCGAHSLAEGTYTITSPNYPSQYGNDMDCAYTLTSAAGVSTFTISCSAFSLESGAPACAYDWLRVNGERFCGSSGPSVTTSGAELNIDFHSDHLATYSGYSCSISIATGAMPQELDCGSHSLAAGLYSIKSPGFPSNYGNNQDCAYSLTAGSGVTAMALDCSTFEIEEDSDCSWDWLRVNGIKYCGSTAPEFPQTFGQLSIDFHSDEWMGMAGYYCEVHATA